MTTQYLPFEKEKAIAVILNRIGFAGTAINIGCYLSFHSLWFIAGVGVSVLLMDLAFYKALELRMDRP